ncbi:MAG TPA: biotin transporter BioY [Acidimicrobiia bacterium]|nr:biotin transporter BioY [Acidimicrobiia bacterium]
MTTAPATLVSRILPRTRAVTLTLVVGFALLTALLAQIAIPLWFTPVPITGQTFSVLLAGAVLGWRAGAASMSLYWLLGAIGLPFYAEARGGWETATGATGGYLVGFVVAAALIGYLAEHRQDRSVTTAIPAFLAGSVIIYIFGLTWLAHSLDVGTARAMELGLAPFVVGDLVKVALAGVALPVAWRLLGSNPD